MQDKKDTVSSQNKTKQNNGWFKENITIILSLVLVVVMLFTVVSPLGLFTAHDAPFQLLAACLGAIVTVLITSLLLKSQTKQQQELQQEQADHQLELQQEQARRQQELQQAQIAAQEELQNKAKSMELRQIKETEQYKTKLRIYQEFLQKLFDAVKDFQLSDDEKLQLQFQTAYIAMHTKDERINKISKYTATIVKELCSEKKNDSAAYNVRELQMQLFNIVRCFQEELYDDDELKTKTDETLRTEAATEFAKIFDSFGSFDNDNPLRIPSGLALGTNDDDLHIWNEFSKRWNQEWSVTRVDKDGFRLERKEKLGAIEIGFWEGHYYIQAEYGGFVDFAKTMKRKYGGRRSYGTWWRHINEAGIYELKQGEFIEKFNQNESILKTVSNWVDILISDIDSFTPFANLWNALNENGVVEKYAQNWYFWIWAEESTYRFERFVCDNVNEEYGDPYIDAYCTDDNIIFVLYNREDNAEKLEKLVKDHNIVSIRAIKEDYQVRLVVKELPLRSSEKEITKCLENLIEIIDSPAMA